MNNNIFDIDSDKEEEEGEEQMTTEQIKETIQSWFKYGNEIKEISKIIKEKRQKQKELTEKLKGVMRNNNID